jgi:hypothetical protein
MTQLEARRINNIAFLKATDLRVRIGRFGGLRTAIEQLRKSERREVGKRKRVRQGRAAIQHEVRTGLVSNDVATSGARSEPPSSSLLFAEKSELHFQDEISVGHLSTLICKMKSKVIWGRRFTRGQQPFAQR